MGWLFCHNTRSVLIEHLTGTEENCEDAWLLRYLDLAPVVRRAPWRESVRAYHDNRSRGIK